MADSAEDLRRRALALVANLHPETLSGEAAMSVVRELSTVEKAVATGRMFAALRVAKTDAWRGQGHASAADWLASVAGISVHEAHGHLRTARDAERLPKTKEQMRKGKLSAAQADAVTSGATADPKAEEDLLKSSEEDTTANLKSKAARARAAATDTATRERRIRSQRSVRTRTDEEGAFCLSLRGPATDGVRLQAMLRPFEEGAFQTGRTSGVRDTFENRSYDAFFALLHHLQEGAAPPASTATTATSAQGRAATTPAPAHGNAADPRPAPPATAASGQTAPGQTAPSSPHRGAGRPAADPPCAGHPDAAQPGAGQPGAAQPGAAHRDAPHPGPGESGASQASAEGAPRAAIVPRGGNNVKVIVRIDHTALARGHTVAGETCDVAGLGPISVATAKALMDDCFLAAVITKGRDVVNVAHLGRGLNAAQRTAIEWSGVACANRACNRTVAIQIDHRVPFAQCHETALANQDPLCPECHRRKTHHGWALEPGTGRRKFLAPPHEPPNQPTQARTRHAATEPATSHPRTSPGEGPPPRVRAQGSDTHNTGPSARSG